MRTFIIFRFMNGHCQTTNISELWISVQGRYAAVRATCLRNRWFASL